MKFKKMFLTILIILIKINIVNLLKAEIEEYGLVIKPVVDIICEPLPNLSFYNNISYSPIDKKDGFSCPRIHQLLFNEVVKVLDQQGDEFVIESSAIFFQHKGSSIKQNKFRILKKNLILFSQLKKFNVDLKKIPKSINYNQKEVNFNKTVTLIEPFTDPKTKKIYSAGTRFIYSHEDNKYYYIYIFNHLKPNLVISQIPRKLCINNQINLDKEKKISNFIKLLQKWASQKKGFIPYVWGGCSYTKSIDDNFIDIKKVIHKKKLHFYTYPKFNSNPKTGFDCTGIILRAAQICDLPYYFKNSITAAQNLNTISKNDKLSDGDIIWIPGHLMIISDVKNNLMIEATDYSSGYGKIHEIEISKNFKKINNYNDLKKAFLEKEPLQRLNKQGNIYQDIPTFKILKISSIWNNS